MHLQRIKVSFKMMNFIWYKRGLIELSTDLNIEHSYNTPVSISNMKYYV